MGEFHPRTKLPFIPGHEFSGEIARVGSEIKIFKIGDRIAVDPIILCGKCCACQIGHFPACTSLKLIGNDSDGGFDEYAKVTENMLFRISS